MLNSLLKLCCAMLVAALAGCATYSPSMSPDSATVKATWDKPNLFGPYQGYRLAEVDGERTSRHWNTPFEQTVTVAPGTHRLMVEVKFSGGLNWMGRGPYSAMVPITATLQPATTYRLMGAISSDRHVEAWLEDVVTGARVSAPAVARSRENYKPVYMPPVPQKQ